MAEQTKLRVAGESASELVRAIGQDESLCLRETSNASSCRACVDICPGKALRLPAGKTESSGANAKVTLSKGFCIDCGLCAAVCPTNSIVIMDPTLRTLRRRIRNAAAQADEGKHVYLTCVETGLAKDDLSVVEISCLGSLTWETWANLILDFPNLAVYLPSDICGRCKAKAAEMMIVDEVVRAQEVTDQELALVETMRELDFTTNTGTFLPERRKKLADSKKDSFGKILNDITTKNPNADDDLPEDEHGQLDARKMRIRIRKEITAAEGEDTPGLIGGDEILGTMTQRRWAILDAVMRYPEIAPRASLEHVVIDAEKADADKLEQAVRECPLGAIDSDGIVCPELCTNCGLCADIFGKDSPAISVVETKLSDLLDNEDEEED
jgi:ferredoxin